MGRQSQGTVKGKSSLSNGAEGGFLSELDLCILKELGDGQVMARWWLEDIALDCN
jgi:hypothetical protein